jgi:hypothetical protein
MKAGDACALMAEKINLSEWASSFDLVDYQKGTGKPQAVCTVSLLITY